MTIELDASNTGWGACWNNQMTDGHWSFEESQLHINVKELLAVFLALQNFAGNKKEIHVLLKLDNMTAIYYINPFQIVDVSDIPDLGLEPGQENHPYGQASPWRPERRRGSEVKEGTGQLRVETRPRHFSAE